MKKQPLILTLTTTLLLTTSSYAFSDNGKACDQDSVNNADKKITLDEFITLKKAKFSQMDTNGDGVLTQNEMRNHRRNQHQPMRRMF